MNQIGLSARFQPFKSTRRHQTRRCSRPLTRIAASLDPDFVEQSLRSFSSNSHHLADIHTAITNLLATVADADVAAGIVQNTTDVAADIVQNSTDVAAEVVQKTTEVATSDAATTVAAKTGWFTSIANALESILKAIDSGLEGLHVPYSYGFSIIILTVLVKIFTFPLSKKQVESSIAMQQLQPQIKEIQDTYKNDPQTVQEKTAALYQTAGVNPLAGCLPTLATIPVFIGLYRALLNAADEGVLSDGFFVIPSLAGPTTISARQAGMGLSWLFPFKDGAPPIGWHDAGAYLVLPVLLVISQYISQQVLQPTRSTDPSQAGAQTFLKFLPLLLGWFSLNVPSGLTLYWITNNVLTTGQQAYLKRDVPTPTTPAAPTVTTNKPSFTPRATTTTTATAVDERAPVIETTATDVKPSGQETGARRSRKGDKFRARKEREAARKARKTAPRRKKKQFIQQPPIEEVATEFAKELPVAPLVTSEAEDKLETESQESNNLS